MLKNIFFVRQVNLKRKSQKNYPKSPDLLGFGDFYFFQQSVVKTLRLSVENPYFQNKWIQMIREMR